MVASPEKKARQSAPRTGANSISDAPEYPITALRQPAATPSRYNAHLMSDVPPPPRPAIPIVDYHSTAPDKVRAYYPNPPAKWAMRLSLATVLLFLTQFAIAGFVEFPWPLVLIPITGFGAMGFGIAGWRRAGSPGTEGRNGAIASVLTGATLCILAGLVSYGVWRMNRIYGPVGPVAISGCAGHTRGIHIQLTLYAKDHTDLLPPQLDGVLDPNGICT
jgi:hypothetical protein